MSDMTVTKELTEGFYKISSGKLWITMQIDFKKGTFTLQSKCGKCDFTFLDADPNLAVDILFIMTEAAKMAALIIQRFREESRYGLDEN